MVHHLFCCGWVEKSYLSLLVEQEGRLGVVAHAVAILALHRELGRDLPEYGEAAGWVRRAVDYLDRTLPNNGGQAMARERLWLVVQGYDDDMARRHLRSNREIRRLHLASEIEHSAHALSAGRGDTQNPLSIIELEVAGAARH